MDVVAIIAYCEVRDIRLEPQGDRLIADGPNDAMTEDLLDGLRRHKAELLAYFSRESYEALKSGIPGLLAWASELSDQDLVTPDQVSYVEAPLRTVSTERVSWYASHYLRTIISARIGQQIGGWGMFDARWRREREKEAISALAALREAMRSNG